MNYPKIGQQLFDAGFEPVPLLPREKYPTMKGWHNASLPIKWPSERHGIGLRTGKLTGIDIDIYDTDMVAELLSCFDGIEIVTRVGMAPKTLIPVICPEVAGKITSNKWQDNEGRLNQIEVLSYGQQFVAYGIHPDTNRPYEWSGELLDHELTVIPMQFIDDLFGRFNELSKVAGWKNITVKAKQAHAKHKVRKSGSRKSGNKPGDLYNRCCSITDVLQEYGWHHYRGDYWCRPGKKHGVSGTVFDDKTFWCFTSATCLLPDRAYDNFGLLTMYEYGGDFAAAAKAVCRTLQEVV